jgi:beta-1,4-mannosyltransferase
LTGTPRHRPAGQCGLRVLAWPAFRKQAANPHAALLARELIAAGVEVIDWTPMGALLRAGDLWHLHHPETVVYRRSRIASLLETMAFLGLLWLARLRGVRILWTVHDLGSNDGLHPRLEAWFWRAFIPAVDAIICLGERSRALALERYPGLAGRPAHVVPHGHYRDAYPQTLSRAAARRRLGLPPEATVLLHFGLLRPYKNVPHLIRTFRALEAAGTVLLVAGRPFDATVEREIRDAAGGAANLRLDLRPIPAAEVEAWFAASDLVVLPYRRILNSGAALLALTFERPVLVPDLGSMPELQEAFGADWLRLYADDLTPAELAAASEWARSTRRAPLDLRPFDWGAIAGRTQAIYEGLARRRPQSQRAASRRRIGKPAR